MMVNVSDFKRSVDRQLIKKLFHKFTSVYGHAWSSRHKSDAEWENCCSTWFEGLCSFEFDVIRKSVGQSVAIHKEFPPSLGQLIDLCLKNSGIPTDYEVIDFMIRRDFSHPLTKIIYDKIGSWMLSHGKPEEIKQKVRNIYAECLLSFRKNPDEAWMILESYHQKEKSIEFSLPKISSKLEITRWRDRMKTYEERSKDEKLRLIKNFHPEWPKEQIVRGGRFFDEQIFNDRRKYLVSLNEELAITLNHDDIFDRGRFLREIEAQKHLIKIGYMGKHHEEEKSRPRGPASAKTVFKSWMED